MSIDIQAMAAAYRSAVGGDSQKALELAIADLLDVKAEADFRARALDQWVSRGYVQGRASEICERQSHRYSNLRAS
jgi:hypothetical protein